MTPDNQTLPKRLLQNRFSAENRLQDLSSYNATAIKYRLENYFKFVFVRQPFERLVSAYLDKFKPDRVDKRYQPIFGAYIVKNYRRNATEKALKEGNDVTFEEFVRYLLDPKTRKKKRFNQHWLSFHETCHPCYVHFDFIGKFETLRDDAAYVIKELGGGVEFPESESPEHVTHAGKFVETMKRNISAEDYKKIKEIYALDFDLFGYDIK